jgi:hypothetical protein
LFPGLGPGYGGAETVHGIPAEAGPLPGLHTAISGENRDDEQNSNDNDKRNHQHLQ